MLRFGFDPQGKIKLAALFILSVKFTRIGNQVVQVTAGKFAIRVFAGIFLYIKINRSINLVCKTIIQDGFYHRYLLADMAGSSRFNAWRKNIEFLHHLPEINSIALHNFHRFKLLQACFLADFILAYIRITFQVTCIGNIAHIAHLITQV